MQAMLYEGFPFSQTSTHVSATHSIITCFDPTVIITAYKNKQICTASIWYESELMHSSC